MCCAGAVSIVSGEDGCCSWLILLCWLVRVILTALCFLPAGEALAAVAACLPACPAVFNTLTHKARSCNLLHVACGS
jgi:hypothetical protein